MTPAGTTHYVYDLSGRLIVEASSTGATLREYIWVDDAPLAVVADVDTATPHLYYVRPDHLNCPSKMTDGAKAVVWDAAYRPFGEVYSITGAASNNLRFPAQYFLLESGLHYNWYRHYDPTIGRYIQPDPLGFADGPSIYAYAKSSPAQYVDLTGRNSIVIGAGIGTVIAGAPGTIAGAVAGGVIGALALDWYFSKSSAPPLPEGLVGSNPIKGSGKRTNTDLPESAFPETVDDLTGGLIQDVGGQKICPNGVRIRPGMGGKGPRIDIPARGSTPPETIHFPPGTTWPWQ